MAENKPFKWEEMTAGAVVEHAKKDDIAILPLGAIEQHGPHCPNGDDSYNAIRMAELISRKTGVMILPCPMYGSHPYHHWKMPANIPLSYETHIALVTDIVRGAAVTGYNKFILLSAHGQVSSTIVAVHKLGLEGYFTLSLHWYDFLRDNKDVLDDWMWHADEAETSVALYLFPEFVDMSKATKGGGEALIDRKFIIAPGAPAKPGMMYHFEGTFARPEYKDPGLKTGVIGDATKATVEKGEKIVTRLVDHVADLIEDIRSRYKPGEKPPVM
ncbi:MAG: creatininase family protein [Anaerolineae bacterium]|nr:creatininase family protein [Anaerolineae bacterium]MDK1080027.1 creatininase family protein [Anaerolineae bacterium]MDK1119345.1 creatininase family protein [Anaerolineae bacterium]